MSGPRRCLLAVHAHPDDEASKGAASVARYAAEGVRTVLVTCTGGEAGDILNPGADTPDVRANLPAVRLEELRQSVAAIGYHRLHLLGYRDSGMPGTPENAHPDAFANADLEEATGRLVAIVRAERPHVMLAYGEDHSGYPHPDHMRAHEIALAAFETAGDRERYPDAGPPWRPLKLYYMGWSRSMMEALHRAFEERRWESPFKDWLARRAGAGNRFTTRIDIGDYLDRRRAALEAHRTQIAPDSFWLRLPDEVLRAAFPYDEYILARSHLDRSRGSAGSGTEESFETDLFAGIDPLPHDRMPSAPC